MLEKEKISGEEFDAVFASRDSQAVDSTIDIIENLSDDTTEATDADDKK